MSDRLVVVIVLMILGVLGSIPDDLKIPIATESRVDSCVPFADVSGLVTVLAKHLGPKLTLRWIVCAAGVVTFHPHGLDAELMMSGQQCCSRRHAPRADVGVFKSHAFFGQPIDRRGFDPWIRLRVTTDRTVRMVIGINEENVWPLVFLSCKG